MGFMKKVGTFFRKWSLKRFAYNLYWLGKYNMEEREFDAAYKIKDELLEECARELEDYKKELVQLHVLDGRQTIALLASHPKSFTRYGDGEIHIMEGQDQPFQKYDPALAQKMLDILAKKRDDVYVGLNHAYWESPNSYSQRNRKFYRVRATGYRRFFTEHCEKESLYLDAACFGAYYRYGDEFDFESHYERIRELFRGKKVAIVAGEGVFEKLEHNVFDRAEAQLIIHGPRIHAFSQYEQLLEQVDKTVPKDYLVCLILGQTATAMVPDLTDMGYMAWDVGHLAKDYDAYMKKTEKTQKNMDAFWAPD